MRLSKKGWLVLSTLAIIGLGFAFYFLVYVQKREADIIAEKMRVLAQIKANIGLLIKNEGEIALNQKEGMILEHPVLSQVPQLIAQKNKGTGEWEQINQAIKKDFTSWTFDTSSQNGFQAREDSATWLDNNMAYRKSYSDFFGKELILRKDNFESVAIVSLGENSGSTLFTNHPSGNISFGDSTVARIQSKSMFEWDSGDDRYIVFTNFLREQGKNQIYFWDL